MQPARRSPRPHQHRTGGADALLAAAAGLSSDLLARANLLLRPLVVHRLRLHAHLNLEWQRARKVGKGEENVGSLVRGNVESRTLEAYEVAWLGE